MRREPFQAGGRGLPRMDGEKTTDEISELGTGPRCRALPGKSRECGKLGKDSLNHVACPLSSSNAALTRCIAASAARR